MANYSLTTPTPVAVGASIPYNTEIVKSCPCIRHRAGSGNIRVKGGTCCRPNRYDVQFHANVTGVTGFAELGIFLDGELLPETVMYADFAADTDVISIDSVAEIAVDGCMQNISVRNIAGTGLVVNTANIIVHRVA